MDLDLRPQPSDVPENSATDDLKKKLLRQRAIPWLQRLEELLRAFTPSERLVLYGLTFVLALSALVLFVNATSYVTTTIPTRGGSIVEGEVGPARFINPVLTLSQPDQDLTALVFSGLMRAQQSGSLIPDLADSYTISDDGTTYTFTLKHDLTFHDGAPLTSEDVVFTVQTIQSPEIKSPHRADWEGVVASAPDDYTVVFKLPKPYAPFIYDTTLGIIPKHLWQDISAEEFPFSPINTHPVGSGPYRLAKMATDSTGSATSYNLEPFPQFALGPAYLEDITFLFYSNDADMIKAFNSGEISALAGVSPSDLHLVTRAGVSTYRAPLPRTFGVFFNQTHAPVLADASVRAALSAAVDKKAIVDQVLGGYGIPLDGPIPPGVLHNKAIGLAQSMGSSTSGTRTENARAILSHGGWSFDQASGLWQKGKGKAVTSLTFTLATADEPELVATAHALVAAWHAAGIEAQVQVYPLSELNTNVIRPRAYDAILFGEVVGREGDLFAFWHSSQRNDPGLNLAMYANSKADTALAQARSSPEPKNREKLYAQFASLVDKDDPAVFLYAPEFIYIVPISVHGIELGALTTPAERFLNAYQWYTDTERVWDIFANIK